MMGVEVGNKERRDFVTFGTMVGVSLEIQSVGFCMKNLRFVGMGKIVV